MDEGAHAIEPGGRGAAVIVEGVGAAGFQSEAVIMLHHRDMVGMDVEAGNTPWFMRRGGAVEDALHGWVAPARTSANATEYPGITFRDEALLPSGEEPAAGSGHDQEGADMARLKRGLTTAQNPNAPRRADWARAGAADSERS